MFSIWFELIACVGLLYILLYSELLRIPREFLCSLHPMIAKLLTCPQCLGFWTGFTIGLLVEVFANEWDGFYSVITAVLLGFATSFVGSLFDSFINFLDSITYKTDENKNENHLPPDKRDL